MYIYMYTLIYTFHPYVRMFVCVCVPRTILKTDEQSGKMLHHKDTSIKIQAARQHVAVLPVHINTYICILIYIHIYTYKCIYIYTYIFTCIYIFICIHICIVQAARHMLPCCLSVFGIVPGTHTCICVCICAHVYVHICVPGTYTYTCTCICAHMCARHDSMCTYT